MAGGANQIHNSQSDRVKKQIEHCLNMKNENDASYDNLRSKLMAIPELHDGESGGALRNLRTNNGPGSDLKKLENSITRFTNSLAALNKSSEVLVECLSFVFNKLEKIEDDLNALTARVLQLEGSDRNSASSVPSYSSICAKDLSKQSERLERLELVASERERESRILQASLTHPLININSSDLTDYIKTFMSNTLKMEPREIDSCLHVSKLRRDHSVLLTFSDARFKNFIYGARKKLQTEDKNLCKDFYLNDNLTQFNLSIFNTLKNERRKRTSAGNDTPFYVFTFQGRVYVKENRDSEKKLIKDNVSCTEFINSL